MNRPSGVRAAEAMTTGSEVAAMAVILKQTDTFEIMVII
jgi:hypothetical protein